MRSGCRFIAVIAVAFWGGVVWAQVPHQGLRGVGGGPSTNFENSLPTGQINRTLGGDNAQYTRGSQFFGAPTPYGAGALFVPGAFIDLRRSGWYGMLPRIRAPGAEPEWAFRLRVRTIDSLQFPKRARFAKLRQAMLALGERVRKANEQSLGQVSVGFRELMFPIPIQESPEIGYGFFSRLDLVGAGSVRSEALLAPFTEEVQASLGEERFLDAAESLLFNRPLPQGSAIDQFYDPQLAALGNYLFNNGRFQTAVRVWEVLVRRDDTSGLWRRGLAISLLASGQMKRAGEEMRASLVRAPGWPDQIQITGSNLQDVFPTVRDLVSARDELKAQIGAKPDDADLAFLVACLDLFQGRWEAAEAGLTRLAPADEVARALLARMKAGAVDETIHRPTSSVLRSLAEDMTGLEAPTLDPAERQHLIAVLRTSPETFEDYMRLGDFHFFMGDYTQASETYRAAHKERPQDAIPVFAMAHASFADGEYALAAGYLKQGFAIEPGWGLYEFRIKEFYGDTKDLQDQVKNLERSISLRASDADSRFLLGYIYYFSGRYADAAGQLSDVLRLKPDFERADYLLRLARIQG